MFTFTPHFQLSFLCHTFCKHFPIPTNSCRDFNIIIHHYQNKVINICILIALSLIHLIIVTQAPLISLQMQFDQIRLKICQCAARECYN